MLVFRLFYIRLCFGVAVFRPLNPSAKREIRADSRQVGIAFRSRLARQEQEMSSVAWCSRKIHNGLWREWIQ